MASNEFLNSYKELQSTEFGSWFPQLFTVIQYCCSWPKTQTILCNVPIYPAWMLS